MLHETNSKNNGPAQDLFMSLQATVVHVEEVDKKSLKKEPLHLSSSMKDEIDCDYELCETNDKIYSEGQNQHQSERVPVSFSSYRIPAPNYRTRSGLLVTQHYTL